jgi:putative PEP-CTERM system TPR-repeat lipoprotein
MYREVLKDAGDKAAGVTARTRIASIMIRSGKTEEGKKLVDEVLATNPSDADALVMRAQLAIQGGKPEDAITDLRTALRDQPTNILLIAQLAQAYIRSGNVALAEQTLRQAVQANPRDAQTRLALAQFLVNKGEADKARPVLEQLVKDDPNNMEALEGYARLLLGLNDPAAALQAATTLQTLQPKSSTGYQLAGVAQQALGRTADARKSFEAGIAADPASLDPLIALAQLDVAAGESAAALARIDARIAAQPDDARLHNLRGELLMAMRRPDDALASYLTASKVQPAWAQPYRGQAVALIATGKTDRAIEVLKAALGPTGNSADIAVDLGTLYTGQDRPGDAIAVYERVLERDPNNLIAANNLAMILVTNRSDAASLERAEKLAVRFAESDNPAFLDTYGWVLYKRGRYAEAIVPLAKAVAKVPQAQEIHYHLGMAQLKAGKTAEASKSLEAALKGEQSYPGKDEAAAALKGL